MGKNYVKKTITYTLAVLLLILIEVVVIDPFSHFHMPLFGMEAVATDERSALIGVAKNDTYDTALIGSSMSENFKDSWFEDDYFGDSAVKLCLQGAHFADYEPVLKEVEKHPELRNIIFSLDTYLLTNNPADNPCTVPEYLSNDNTLDDAYYVFNKSVILRYIPIFIYENIKEGFSDDNAYVWSDKYNYDKYSARGAYNTKRPMTVSMQKDISYYYDYTDQFIESIIPYVEARPDVTFYFYCSPYSMLFWDFSFRNGDIVPEIGSMERTMNRLLDYENVRIFYFQDDYDIVTDLNNYRDYSHFKQDVNYYMYECMRDGKKEVTKEDYFDTLLDMYNYAIEYDYETLFH